MKNKFLLGTIVMIVLCHNLSATVVANDSINTYLDSLSNYDGYNAEFAADKIDNKDSIRVITQDPILIFESDTINLGTIKRSDAALLEHILCKCNSSQDVCIKKISIDNRYGRVSASPRIAAGTKGTILCIIDKKSLKVGNHIDKITILTDSKTSPEMILFVKYYVVE